MHQKYRSNANSVTVFSALNPLDFECIVCAAIEADTSILSSYQT